MARASIDQIRGLRWANLRLVKACPGSRIRGWCKGGGRYVGDMVLPGMVFGYVLRSPHAHARIRSIDTAKAKAAPGVLAVLTGPTGRPRLGRPAGAGRLKRRDGSAVFQPPYPALAEDRVRWVGDYVAFVVAETTSRRSTRPS